MKKKGPVIVERLSESDENKLHSFIRSFIHSFIFAINHIQIQQQYIEIYNTFKI